MYVRHWTRGSTWSAIVTLLLVPPVAWGEPTGPAFRSAPPRAASAVDGTWSVDTQPAPRFGHCAIYDPLRDRMLVFGGLAHQLQNDVWELALHGYPTWTRLQPLGTPPGMRQGMSGVYDSKRDRLLIVAGSQSNGLIRTDVWALSLGGTPTWAQLMPTGPLPIPRWRQAAIYDPVRDRLLMFGGTNNSAGEMNDLWALPLSGPLSWTQISPAGTPPAARYGPGAIYDPVRDQMIVFGGTGRVGGVLTIFNDVWAVPLDGAPTWTALTPAGIPPQGRSDMCLIYDRPRDRMVMSAGARLGTYLNDSWELLLSGAPAWQSLAPTAPLPEIRTQASSIYDPLRARMVVFGGAGASYIGTNDVWGLSLGAAPRWQPLRPSPHPRDGHRAVLDTNRNQMIVFGDQLTSDVWTMSLAGPPVWTLLAPTGTPPAARIVHAAIFDPVRDRMLVFGGYAASPAIRLNDLWSLSLTGTSAWTQLAPAGGPPTARELHSAIYDPIRDRMLVFGGYDGSVLNDLWELSLADPLQWTRIVPASAPPPIRQGHQAIYDPVRDRMVVFGGVNNDANDPYSDVWALTLSGSPTWQQLWPGGATMDGRWGHTAVYDSRRDRMVVFGGFGPFIALNYDTWELMLEDVGTWTPLSRTGVQPNPMYDHSAIYDPLRDRMVVFGGYGVDSAPFNDVWTLDWTASVSVSPSDGNVVRLSPARPNPAAGPVSFEFTLATSGPADLCVYDVSGRLLRTLKSGELSAGPHSVRWDGRLASGGRAPAGVYFCQLHSAGTSLSRRFVLLE